MNDSIYSETIKKRMIFFKLMNSSVYGKTINARLVNNAKRYRAYKNQFLG